MDNHFALTLGPLWRWSDLFEFSQVPNAASRAADLRYLAQQTLCFPSRFWLHSEIHYSLGWFICNSNIWSMRPVYQNESKRCCRTLALDKTVSRCRSALRHPQQSCGVRMIWNLKSARRARRALAAAKKSTRSTDAAIATADWRQFGIQKVKAWALNWLSSGDAMRFIKSLGTCHKIHPSGRVNCLFFLVQVLYTSSKTVVSQHYMYVYIYR